jgi:hypothetical protein
VDTLARKEHEIWNDALKPVRYIVEVYEPGSTDTVANRFDSLSALMPIREGELISPVRWSPEDAPHLALRVTEVEHVIENFDDHIMNKVMVYIERVDFTKS